MVPWASYILSQREIEQNVYLKVFSELSIKLWTLFSPKRTYYCQSMLSLPSSCLEYDCNVCGFHLGPWGRSQKNSRFSGSEAIAMFPSVSCRLLVTFLLTERNKSYSFRFLCHSYSPESERKYNLFRNFKEFSIVSRQTVRGHSGLRDDTGAICRLGFWRVL